MTESDCDCNVHSISGGVCLACGRVHDMHTAFNLLQNSLVSMSNPHNVVLINAICKIIHGMYEKYLEEGEIASDTEFEYSQFQAIFRQDPGWNDPAEGESGLIKDFRVFMAAYAPKDFNTKKSHDTKKQGMN